MIKKLILTIAVILAVVLFVRYKQRRLQNKVGSVPAGTARHSVHSPIEIVALILLVMMVVGSLLWGYMVWQEKRVIVQIDVINTNNGKTTVYSAYKNSIKNGVFVTPEGKKVRLGANERMETKIQH